MSEKISNVGGVKGVLNILPTNKGDTIMVGDGDLMWLLNTFNGKNVQITISEITTISTDQSSRRTEK